jgi:hypothetical protein
MAVQNGRAADPVRSNLLVPKITGSQDKRRLWKNETEIGLRLVCGLLAPL